ncbi:hypothetical protein [Corynebacterium freneyi]|uniref:Uncharacterized protein n=1 Tax=Corynebacterium freneyi TaxID=134034 RepID=A0ABS4U4S3_9CORY|nr:hypothetical protein [Corynebacterium freneyi]MBP2331657.1 hypothetical protein [Corynebacterium freneyi]QXA51886.1 hypothetical protein I6L56_07015 [Corynebacterium freneyi]WJZ06220.1 hypothetical protein CFREN_11425 [Corynebacterium freneyi]
MSDNDSDNIIARKPAVISAADGVDGGRRTARTVVGAVLGALVLAGGGFFVGAAVGQNSGGADDASEVAYESTFFGSSSSGSSAPGSSAGRDGGAADADGDSGDGGGAGDAGAGGADAPSPTPESGKGSSGRTGYAVQGDVIEIEGEDVLVCLTGNGFGLSHVGVTLEAGADGDATAADSERLCADALRLTGALIMADGDGDLLGTARDVNAAGHAYRCRPVAEKVLRCTAEDGSIVTLWSAEP